MTSEAKPKLTVPDLAKKKAAGERLSMVAVADFMTATWAHRAGIDIVEAAALAAALEAEPET